MPTFWITEKANALPEPEDESWQDRVSELPDVQVLVWESRRLKVKAGDEIALRAACTDIATVERVTG